MTKPVQYKTTLAFLLTAGAEAIDKMLHRIMPEATFGIVIYQEDDVESNTVTYLLYEDTPESLYITFNIRQRTLATMLTLMSTLNPHVGFLPVWNSCYSKDTNNRGLVVYELLVISKTMKVDFQGILVEHTVA